MNTCCDARTPSSAASPYRFISCLLQGTSLVYSFKDAEGTRYRTMKVLSIKQISQSIRGDVAEGIHIESAHGTKCRFSLVTEFRTRIDGLLHGKLDDHKDIVTADTDVEIVVDDASRCC